MEFPDLDGSFTFGDTLEEALAMAKDAMEQTLCDVFDGRPLPVAKTMSDEKNGLYAIEVSSALTIVLQLVAARGKRRSGRPPTKWGCTCRRTSGSKIRIPTFPSGCLNASLSISGSGSR